MTRAALCRLAGRGTSEGAALMRFEACDNGTRRRARRPYVDQREGRIAVVTGGAGERVPSMWRYGSRRRRPAT